MITLPSPRAQCFCAYVIYFTSFVLHYAVEEGKDESEGEWTAVTPLGKAFLLRYGNLIEDYKVSGAARGAGGGAPSSCGRGPRCTCSRQVWQAAKSI